MAQIKMPFGPEIVVLEGTAHLVIMAEPGCVRAGLMSLTSTSPLRDLNEDDRATAELVLAEVLNNIAEHAYSENPGAIEVWIERTVAGVSCTILDIGSAMPGEAAPDGALPAINGRNMGDLPEGGFGWFMIRSLCTELTYEYSSGQNRLSFTLPISGVGCAHHATR